VSEGGETNSVKSESEAGCFNWVCGSLILESETKSD
jgi:hypothetical protein